jgi:transcriptional regulator with XRE-family HTH domain
MTEDHKSAVSAAVQLAHEIRRLRRAAGLSQRQLAGQVGYTRQYLSMAEKVGANLPSPGLVRALDVRLKAGGGLVALRERAKADQSDLRRSVVDRGTFASLATIAPRVIDGIQHDAAIIEAPAGRFFAGSSIPVLRYPAQDDGRIVMRVPVQDFATPQLRRPGRALVAGAVEGSVGHRLFGLDSRVARNKLASSAAEAPLLVPRAYEIDDLTLGLLWAVANFDDALLDDDGQLAARMARLTAYEQDQRSTGGREIGADLSAVSQMWLGSDFCARHILRHADAMIDTPTFWTREQRGEEASSWLFFAHKYRYLADTAGTFHTTSATSSRAFCVPMATVASSRPPERILLFLAVALMESFGIQVKVCLEAEYSGMQGFALDQRRRAIVANWVGTDGVWQVDVTDERPLLREFADASGYAQAHSILAGRTAPDRLRAFADYLDLDWSWLVSRCSELGDYGVAGLAQVRSRLLSTAGADRACRFVGDLGRDSTGQ